MVCDWLFAWLNVEDALGDRDELGLDAWDEERVELGVAAELPEDVTLVVEYCDGDWLPLRVAA